MGVRAAPAPLSMALFRGLACGCVVASVHALDVATRAAGDPQPPQYPVLNVHVTEPLAARASMDDDALTQQQQMDILDAMDARLLASERALSNAVREIAARVDTVAKALEAS